MLTVNPYVNDCIKSVQAIIRLFKCMRPITIINDYAELKKKHQTMTTNFDLLKGLLTNFE